MRITADGFHLVFSYLIRGSLLFAMVVAAIEERWISLFVTLAIFILTFLPSMIERNVNVVLPPELELVVMLFIYGSLFLGEMHAYYTRFAWWDILLHASSAIVLGFIGFFIVYVLTYSRKTKLKMSPAFIALFSFTFALAIGALWEIFEFSMDQVFLTNMQKSGLIDTMWDLIVDSLGALFVSVGGYLYVKHGNAPLFGRSVKRFERENPHFFKR